MSWGVLVVDDEADTRELSRMCPDVVGGYTVDTASSGLVALQVSRPETRPTRFCLT
jgi:CheY-like chemotaxis protein